MSSFGKNLRYYRSKNKMSQAELADKLNSSQTTISSWERCLGTPSLPMIKQLSEILNVPINKLLYNEDAESDINSFESDLVASFHAADDYTKDSICKLLGITLPD